MITHVPGYDITTDRIMSKTLKNSYVKIDAGFLFDSFTTTNSTLTVDNAHDSYLLKNSDSNLTVIVLESVNDFLSTNSPSIRRIYVTCDSRESVNNRNLTFVIPNTFVLVGDLILTRALYRGSVQVFVIDIVNNYISIHEDIGSYFELDDSGNLIPLGDKNICPKSDGNRSLGLSSKRWLNGYFNSLDISNNSNSPINSLQRSTSYSVGDVVVNNSLNYKFYLECTTAGTSGSSLPSFTNKGSGDSVTDGSVVWAIKTVVSKEYVDHADSLKANIDSPSFTGTPTTPTPQSSDNSTKIANTEWVKSKFNTISTGNTSGTISVDGVDVSVNGWSDKADLNSPTFTGSPKAPTKSQNDNSTNIATTEYVDSADSLKANINSPNFTGTPTAPTAAAGTNNTQIATTEYVNSILGDYFNTNVVTYDAEDVIDITGSDATAVSGIIKIVGGHLVTMCLWVTISIPNSNSDATYSVGTLTENNLKPNLDTSKSEVILLPGVNGTVLEIFQSNNDIKLSIFAHTVVNTVGQRVFSGMYWI